MTQLFALFEDEEETVRFTTSSGLTGVSLTLIELHSVEQRGIAVAFRTPGKFFFAHRKQSQDRKCKFKKKKSKKKNILIRHF